jgi:hypothetical protein
MLSLVSTRALEARELPVPMVVKFATAKRERFADAGRSAACRMVVAHVTSSSVASPAATRMADKSFFICSVGTASRLFVKMTDKAC